MFRHRHRVRVDLLYRPGQVRKLSGRAQDGDGIGNRASGEREG